MIFLLPLTKEDYRTLIALNNNDIIKCKRSRLIINEKRERERFRKRGED